MLGCRFTNRLTPVAPSVLVSFMKKTHLRFIPSPRAANDPQPDRSQNYARPPDESDDLAQAAWRMQVLHGLAEIGMERARALHGQALGGLAAKAPDGADLDVGLVFLRISGAVCQAIALDARIAEDCRTLSHLTKAERAAGPKTQHRDKIKRLLAAAIEDDIDDIDDDLEDEIDEIEDLLSYPDIRLVDLNAFDDIREVIARICQDLGLDPNEAHWPHYASAASVS
jgi:hypothetical protein